MANNRNDLGPISVSGPGTSLTTAQGKQLTFNTRYPFAKLDSTKTPSFQIITLFFNTEPPNPVVAPGFSGSLETLVYRYAHGYTYIPATWFLISLDNFVTTLGSEGAWIVGAATGFSPANVQFNIKVDSTYVNFYVNKNWSNDGITPAPSVIGFSVTIRAYIFVNDLAGTDVPASA
jgi:hypothetical protein